MLWKLIQSLFTSKPKAHTVDDALEYKYPLQVENGEPILVKRDFSGKKESRTTRMLAAAVATNYYEYVQRQILIDLGEAPIGGGDIGVARGIWEVADMIVDCKNHGFMSELHFDIGLYTSEFINELAKEIAKECRHYGIRTTRWFKVTWSDDARLYAEKLLLALEGEYLDHV